MGHHRLNDVGETWNIVMVMLEAGFQLYDIWSAVKEAREVSEVRRVKEVSAHLREPDSERALHL